MGRVEKVYWILGGLLTSVTLAGCTGTMLNTQVHEAWAQRNAASTRLINAAAGYCASRFETLEGRISCLAGQATGWPVATFEGAVDLRGARVRYARLFTCEHHRTSVTCLRASPPWTEALTADHQ